MDMRTATEIAYKYDHACVFSIAGAETFIHLPHKELQWLIEQPDTEIDVKAQIIDSLQFNYTLMDPNLAHRPAHISIVSGPLIRDINNLIPELPAEIQHSVDNIWGTDLHRNAFKHVCVFDTMCRIIGQATNRVFVGLSVCRDPALLDSAMAFSLDMPTALTLIQFSGHLSVPWLHHSLLCRIASTLAASSTLFGPRFSGGWRATILRAQ